MTATTVPMSARGYYAPSRPSYPRHYNNGASASANPGNSPSGRAETQKPQRTQAKRAIGHYILGKTIGEGTFGKVKLGTHILTGEKVAIKILEKEKIVDISDVERVSREIKILKLIRHPHIVQLYEIIETHRQLYLIMEYAPGGELFDYIVDNQRVNEDEACKFFRQIICGVEKIHELGVVHRDLKPENLLLDEEKNIKIVDFGLSNTFDKGQLLKTACGSPCYAAPEMIAGKSYVDVVPRDSDVSRPLPVCGYLPFEDQNTAQLYKKIMSGHYQTPGYVTANVKSLIKVDVFAKKMEWLLDGQGLLTTNPEKRMRVADIRRHPWFLGEAARTSLSRELNFGAGSSKGCEVSSCDRCKTWAFGGTDPTDPTLEFGVDEDVLDEVVKIGDFSKEYAVKCLKINKHNHVTTSYYLLLEKKARHAMELRKAGRRKLTSLKSVLCLLSVPVPGDNRSTATIPAGEHLKASPKKGGDAKTRDAELFEKFDRMTEMRAVAANVEVLSERKSPRIRPPVGDRQPPLPLKDAEKHHHHQPRAVAPPSEASSAPRSGRDLDALSNCTSPGQHTSRHAQSQAGSGRSTASARRKVPSIPLGRVNLNDGLGNSPASARGYVPRGAPPPQSARLPLRSTAMTPRLYDVESPQRYMGARGVVPPLSARLRGRKPTAGVPTAAQGPPQSARAPKASSSYCPPSVVDRLYQRAAAPASGGGVRPVLSVARPAVDAVPHRPATTGVLSARSPPQAQKPQQVNGHPIPTAPATARPTYNSRPPSSVAGRAKRPVHIGGPNGPPSHRPQPPVPGRRSSYGGNPPSTTCSSISNTMPCAQPPIITVTTTKDPRAVLHDTYRALAALGIQSTRTEPFNISCNRSGLQFDLEITQLDKVQSVYVVRFRKTVGDHSQFREVTRRLVHMLKL